MGCVSSNLLSNEESFTQLGGSALGMGHHIVSLTSTTYGLLNLDPPTTTTTAPTPPPRFTLGSVFPPSLSDSSTANSDRTSLWSQPSPFRSDPPQEVINSWELMSGLDPIDSFRFSPLPQSRKDHPIEEITPFSVHRENANPNFPNPPPPQQKPQKEPPILGLLEGFEPLCPPNGENRVVIYTTSLRGIRKTFEACSAVRAAIESFGIQICERDISMDRGFKEELKDLMARSGNGCRKGEVDSSAAATVLPRVFVRGRYLGGMEEVMRIVEEGRMAELLQGLPRSKAGGVSCEGCGNVRFLPCFSCNGSCKVVTVVKEKETGGDGEVAAARSVVVRCPDCNENGLVLCPICS
ncbi:unnamed protein product [Linum trigynum]|uniref:Glutaredoxin domain-containing protein n=1 Tax=Linum trigynum TaxID=586398 RepID=A0AAV2DIN3_9ROSI